MTVHKPFFKQLSTGVPGLDNILGGGLPEFSFNLIGGPPGSGKTTIAFQMMFATATPEKPAIYFTALGEPPLKMLRYQQQFDFFDLDQLNRCIHIVNLAEDLAVPDLNKVLAKIAAEVEALEPTLVVVDSFRSIVLASQGEGKTFGAQQQFTQDLGVLLASWQATTFLVGEYTDTHDPNPIFTVADGLIWLRQSTEHNSVVRKIEIAKMRGQATRSGLHTFRITDAGIKVFPPAQFTVPAGSVIESPTTTRLSMGIAGLDEMMGGGLPLGYSLLVAGPSGSGKSILAAAFLAEGVRSGEKGVIAAFETRPKVSRARVVADLIAAGDVELIETPGVDLSVDEVAVLLMEKIQKIGATRVVIDSLSGFELTLAPSFRQDFRESLARFVAALASRGVTVLMTSELEDRYQDLRFSPYGSAFLTDAIIVQRYIEVDSRLQRMLGVVKVRASAHSNELRLFDIDNDGIKIGKMLAEQEGLLGGRPTRRKVTPNSRKTREK
jgi:circadian clock protein KaiC